MDTKKFEAGLAALLRECGAELSSSIEITLSAPTQEIYPCGTDRPDSLQAVRERRPAEITIRAATSEAGDWHHESGDDRRLHPDLRSNT